MTGSSIGNAKHGIYTFLRENAYAQHIESLSFSLYSPPGTKKNEPSGAHYILL